MVFVWRDYCFASEDLTGMRNGGSSRTVDECRCRHDMNYDLSVTVEPLSNDHPHQRPSLLYDHISCDVVGAAQHI